MGIFMTFAKVIFVVLLCIPIGYVAILCITRLIDDVLNNVKKR